MNQRYRIKVRIGGSFFQRSCPKIENRSCGIIDSCRMVNLHGENENRECEIIDNCRMMNLYMKNIGERVCMSYKYKMIYYNKSFRLEL